MNTQVTVKLISPEYMIEFYRRDIQSIAKNFLAEGQYKLSTTFTTEKTGEDAAEEAFDLSNNPSRQYERSRIYGKFRSVSVGDIVSVDGVDYLCAPCGWEKL